MIYLLFGIILGLLLAILIFVILAYFRKNIEQQVTVIEKQLSSAGPKPRGYVIEPEDEAEEIRQEIIEKNRREGRDTKFEELL